MLTAVSITITATVVTNLPLGFWRAGLKKFSWQWFLALHLSIPLIVLIRIKLGVSLWYVPLVIAAAIGGQFLGSAIRKRLLTQGIE